MHKRDTLSRSGGALWAVALLLGLAGGCSTDTEMNGVRVPNAAPDTRVTGQPPTLLEASYAVEFRWTGSDADGRIRGYQWKLSDNGTDGISPQDTLTVDPLTGAVLHPWNFTASTDSSFLVLADQPGFPGDVGIDVEVVARKWGIPRTFTRESVEESERAVAAIQDGST